MNRKNGDFLSYDEKYMRLAMQLAGNAIGRTSPNPLVGAVIVKDNRVVGCGWHRKAGTPHAEVHALNQAGELAQGADVYVTLEPCAHYGKTPPCAKALVEAKVKNVYGGLLDVNPKVAGKGFKILEDAGIHVEYGFLQDELRKQNEVFFKWIEHKKPFVVLKAAMTLDGKIATATGQSKWITNETSRAYGYKLRDIYDGIMVGINTVIEDNPMLTARVDGGKNPIRIVVDSSLKIDINANVVQDKSAKTIIATTDKADKDKILKLQAQDVDVIVVDKDKNDKVDIEKLLDILAKDEAHFAPIYSLDLPIADKIKTIAKEIYGADDVTFSKKVLNKMKKYESQGLGNLPICVAKTQYSDDPTLLGKPSGFKVTISDLIPNTGAGFLVAISGDIMRMPGLPKVPAAVNMDIDEEGKIVGLF